MKKIFVITGEHSGDTHAAQMVQELKKIYNDVEIEGVGGQNLKNEGVKLFSDHKKMSAMGFSLKILFNHLSLGKRIVEYIKTEFKPDFVVLVDYGAFNLSIAKILKGSGIKIFYYIPPQVWASRKWRINIIKDCIDKVFCIFPFEVEMYQKAGIPVHYCGHPLTSQLPAKANKEEFFNKYNLDLDKKLVSVFPGSRPLELHFLMKLFLKSAKLLKQLHPDLQFCISQAPNLSDEVFEKYLKNTDIKVIKGDNHALLSVSDALILASGTVALEAALYETPMIIAYRAPMFLYLVYLLVRCIDKVSLPNIITGNNIVEELIQFRAKYDLIAYNIEKLLYDNYAKNKQVELLKDVRNLLSTKVSSVEVANQLKEELIKN